MLVVQALARILLQVQAGDADLALLPLRQIEDDRALADDGLGVLRNLVAGRQIGVEIVLPVEHGFQVDLGIEAEAGPDRLLDAFAVDDGQHAGERGIDQAHLRIGLGAKSRGGAGEQLGLRDHLGMRFQPQDALPLARAALDPILLAHDQNPSGLALNPALLSVTPATWNKASSPLALPIRSM